MAYEDTPNKAFIRQRWNYPLLREYSNSIQRKLTYFGLTGPELRDLVDWRPVLDAKRTTVESPGKTPAQKSEAERVMRRINANALAIGISSGLQLLRSDIEDVILNAGDNDGNPPQINDGGPAQSMRFGYDIINLDFDGGLGYKRTVSAGGESPRTNALKKIFERQKGHDFILLITVNVRHGLENDIDTYISELQHRHKLSSWRSILSWFSERGMGELEHKLKVVVPLFVRDAAEQQNFRCSCYPPICYVGHKLAKMLHFSFSLKSDYTSLRSFSHADDYDLVQLPLLRSDKGKIFLDQNQHPNHVTYDASKHLWFLTSEERTLFCAPQASQI